MRIVFFALGLVALAAGCGAGTSSPLPPAQSSASGLLVSPNVNPPGPPGATLIGLSFTAAGAQQAFLAAETGYAGAIAQTNSCAGIVTVSPASASGPSAVFNVTAVAAGNCQVTVKDSSNKSAAVLVTVTTTTGGIQ